MIVIGVPNCIYLLNKYHAEYKRHGNKALALTREWSGRWATLRS